jgi:hypothetical protein
VEVCLGDSDWVMGYWEEESEVSFQVRSGIADGCDDDS